MADISHPVIHSDSGHFKEATVDVMHPELDPAGTTSTDFDLIWEGNQGESVVLRASVGIEIGGGYQNFSSKRWEGGDRGGFKIWLPSYANRPDLVIEFGKAVVPGFDPENERQTNQLRRELNARVQQLQVAVIKTDEFHSTLRISADRKNG